MSTIVTRSGKGSPLTHNEVDTNFTNLNTDKVEKTAADITGGTINNTTIGATTPSTGVFTTLTATGQTSLGGAAGSESLRVLSPVATGSYLQVQSSSSAFVEFRALGTNSNNTLGFVSRGSGTVSFYTNNSTSNEQLRVSPTASAVNYVQVTGAATGAPSQPIISAQGSDANINIALQGKGTGAAVLLDSGGGGTLRAIPRATGGDTFLDVRRDIGGVSLLASSSVTNGSVNLISKGTGAIDLAAGSSGVNISNGGTVTAITRTANGTGYTSIPSVAITAPTTAGGVQATATATMFAITATVQAGGTGYAVGNVLTVVGGTYSSQATFTVSAVSAGVVTAVTLTSGGTAYSVLPTNPVSTTGGTGTGATLNITSWGVSTIPVGTAGSGYVEQPTVTFSGGGGSGAAAYATVGSGTTIKSIGATLDLSVDNTSSQAFRFYNSGGTGTAYWSAASGSTSPFLYAQGSTNTTGRITSNGTGSVALYTNGGSNLQFNVAHTASAVNYVQVTGAATGGTPAISVQGSDTNTGLTFINKGTSAFEFRNDATSGAFGIELAPNTTVDKTTFIDFHSSIGTDFDFRLARTGGANNFITYVNNGTGGHAFQTAGGTEQLRVVNTASAVNYVQVTGAATGGSPTISSQGSDSNTPLIYQTKGFGSHQFRGYGGSNIFLNVYAAQGSPVNYLQIGATASGSGPVVSSQGSDTNIDLALTPKGTGNVRFGTYTGTALSIAGYIEIKDSGGTVRKLAVVA